MSLSPVTSSVQVTKTIPEPKVAQGFMENFDKEHMGALIGKGGVSLKKFVTGKSAYQIKEAYAKDYSDDSENKTSPEDLGPILVKVKVEEVDGQMEFTLSIHNDKENLDVYQPIVRDNLFTHAKNCSVKKNTKFRNHIVFSTNISHEGIIGKFVGSKGKNIKMLSEKVKQSLGVKFLSIKMVPLNEVEKVRPLKNKVVRIKTNPENTFEVQIIVSVNLPKELFEDYTTTMKKITPIINESVKKLDEDTFKGEDEIMADAFLGEWVPNGNVEKDEDHWGPKSDDDEGW